MTEGAVLEAPSTARQVLDMVAGVPLPDPAAVCQPCHRLDLQLLIVTPSVVAGRHADALQAAGYRWADALDPAFGALPREATIPVARLPQAGYVYLYYPARGRWDVWQVMRDGLTRKIVHQADERQCAGRLSGFAGAAPPKQCSRGAKNLLAHTVCIEGAHTLDTVWFAYGAELWPLGVLQRYAANPEVEAGGTRARLRDLRGRELSLKRLMAGAGAPGCLPLDRDTLAHHVADFADSAPPAYAAAFRDAVRPMDTGCIGEAEAFAADVRAVEKRSGTQADPEVYAGKSAVLMLPDPVGVAEQYNQLRLLSREARDAWVQGGPDAAGSHSDPLRAWKLRSALHEEMIESWVYAQKLHEQKQLAAAGAYRDHQIISGDAYRHIQAEEQRTGKPYGPPGTRYEKLAGPVERYRVTWPEHSVQSGLEGIAHANARSRIERYRGKVRLEHLDGFRAGFKRTADDWEQRIAAFDADFVAWLRRPELAAAVRYDADECLDLTRPRPEDGTPLQQVEAWTARLRTVGRCWGGGALTPVSARELAEAYGKDPDAPARWIDQALLQPFGAAQAIVGSPGGAKDVAEKINLLLNELPEKTREILHLRREVYGEHLLQLTQAGSQAAYLRASLVDPAHARALGLAPIAPNEAERAFTLQIRTAAILDLMADPAGERYVTIGIELPPGQALDAAARAFQRGEIAMELQTKLETDRRVRRWSAMKLHKLAGRAGLDTPEYQPVILTRSRLAELEKLAARHGDDLVEVVAAGALGENLPATLRLPRSVALNLIGEQAEAALAARQALLSRTGATAGVLGVFQAYALWHALGRLRDTEGYAHTDVMMSVLDSAAGLLEGALNVASGYYEIRAAGGRLTLASVSVRAATIRLAGGIAGAAASAFAAYAAYASYCSARERGSKAAMDRYLVSADSFLISGIVGGAGSFLIFASKTTTRFALSEAVVTRMGGIALAELAGEALTGVGLLLGLVGFAYMLYAVSLEDDLNEVFLKRSYWGEGRAAAAPYGSELRPPIALGPDGDNLDVKPANRPAADDAAAFERWARRGLEQEGQGFRALSVGLDATLEWADGDAVVAHLKTPRGDARRFAAYTLTVEDASGARLAQLRNEAGELEAGPAGASLKAELALDPAVWAAGRWAWFEYALYTREPRDATLRDTLRVERPA